MYTVCAYVHVCQNNHNHIKLTQWCKYKNIYFVSRQAECLCYGDNFIFSPHTHPPPSPRPQVTTFNFYPTEHNQWDILQSMKRGRDIYHDNSLPFSLSCLGSISRLLYSGQFHPPNPILGCWGLAILEPFLVSNVYFHIPEIEMNNKWGERLWDNKIIVYGKEMF